jgi:UDP-N-acetylglucosamine acyltransferase
MAYAHVAHDCIIGNYCILGNAVNMAGHVVVDDYAILSGMSAIHQFVHIGAHVMVSGGSLVRKDIPPFVKAAREPMSYVGINSIGLRRRGFSNERISEIQDIYRVLFQSGLNTTKAIQKIETDMPASPERDEIVLFVQAARRGIIRGYGSEE